MPESPFSIKESLSHGFAMAKKFIGVFIGAGVIYVVLMVLTGGLDSQAGTSSISVAEMRDFYEDEEDVQYFRQMLEEEGYITRGGFLTKEFHALQSAEDLRLWSEFEPDRWAIYDFLQQFRYRLPFPRYVYYPLRFGLWIVEVLMGMGFVKMFVAAARDRKPEISELFSNGSKFIPYLLASICYGLAVMGGLILLIIPAFIFAVRLGFYPYLVLDKGLGPIVSLRRSHLITKGFWWKLVGFGCVVFLVNVLGFLCLIVGLVLTIPATSIAFAHIYDKLENPVQEAEMVT